MMILLFVLTETKNRNLSLVKFGECESFVCVRLLLQYLYYYQAVRVGGGG